MSLNRDKESDKEIENLKKSQVAWVKEYAPDALTPEEIIEKIVEKEVQVDVVTLVDNPEHIEMIERLTEQLKASQTNEQKLIEDVGKCEDTLTDKITEINALTINMAAAEVTISEYKETKKEDALIIKSLEQSVLKLKKAVKELTT